eukprot:534623-Pleurochrysis_carterae.AAC.1
MCVGGQGLRCRVARNSVKSRLRNHPPLLLRRDFCDENNDAIALRCAGVATASGVRSDADVAPGELPIGEQLSAWKILSLKSSWGPTSTKKRNTEMTACPLPTALPPH